MCVSVYKCRLSTITSLSFIFFSLFHISRSPISLPLPVSFLPSITFAFLATFLSHSLSPRFSLFPSYSVRSMCVRVCVLCERIYYIVPPDRHIGVAPFLSATPPRESQKLWHTGSRWLRRIGPSWRSYGQHALAKLALLYSDLQFIYLFFFCEYNGTFLYW